MFFGEIEGLVSSLESALDETDDIVFEENTEVTGADFQKKYSALKTKVKELEAKASEYLNGWQRDRADFLNLRKKDEEVKKELSLLQKRI